MAIPIDLGSLLIGAVVGATVYWLATHVDVWFDGYDRLEEEQHRGN